MGYIKTLPLPPPRCRSVPHQLPPASAVCTFAVPSASPGLVCSAFSLPVTHALAALPPVAVLRTPRLPFSAGSALFV